MKLGFVFCMICWYRVGELGHHKCVKECGSPEAYANKVGLPKGVSLWCERFAGAKSRVSKKKCTSHLEKWRATHPGPTRGRSKPSEWKALPGGGSAADAALVWEWIVEERPIEKVAAKYHMSQGTKKRRLGRILGFSIRRFCTVVHGEPVTTAWVRTLIERFCLKVHELGEALGRDRNFADHLTRANELKRMPR